MILCGLWWLHFSSKNGPIWCNIYIIVPENEGIKQQGTIWHAQEMHTRMFNTRPLWTLDTWRPDSGTLDTPTPDAWTLDTQMRCMPRIPHPHVLLLLLKKGNGGWTPSLHRDNFTDSGGGETVLLLQQTNNGGRRAPPVQGCLLGFGNV